MARIDRGSLKSSVIGHHFLPRRDPEVIEMRSGGGCISVFGLPEDELKYLHALIKKILTRR